MNKISCFLVALLVIGCQCFAQNAGKPAKPAATKTAPAAANKTNAKPDQKTQHKSTGKKLKKDGTPDMRYKENKAAAKPATKLKKDGTPDMRHKQNKDAVKKK